MSLLVVPEGEWTPDAEGHPVATAHDHVAGENILPFPGQCLTTGAPCSPQTPRRWSLSERDAVTRDMRRLITVHSVLWCIAGSGEIVILNPGQSTVAISVSDDGYRYHGNFRLVDEETGEPLRGRKYRITSASGIRVEGETDDDGETVRVGTHQPEELHLELVDEGDEPNLLHDDDESDDDDDEFEPIDDDAHEGDDDVHDVDDVIHGYSDDVED